MEWDDSVDEIGLVVCNGAPDWIVSNAGVDSSLVTWPHRV